MFIFIFLCARFNLTQVLSILVYAMHNREIISISVAAANVVDNPIVLLTPLSAGEVGVAVEGEIMYAYMNFTLPSNPLPLTL